MQNLLTSVQMRSADAFTIRQRRISSIELMEAASLAFAGVFIEEVADKNTSVAVLCGRGNNGADGLAVSRILKEKGYEKITVFLLHFSTRETEEYRVNLDRLTDLGFQPVTVTTAGQLAGLEQEVIIDAVLGSGLNKALAGDYLELAGLVNALDRKVIAVDVPTGFPAEGVINKNAVCIKADLVICFQRPKINFFFPESLLALNRFRVVDIGLDEDFIQQQDSPYRLVEPSFIQQMVKPRQLFSHKGTYGHALIVAGQANTMGAALLSARACLFGGAGLTTLSIPESGLTALNTSLPEVMYVPRTKLTATEEFKKYKAIAIGPGLGTDDEGLSLLQTVLKLNSPMVIDADALNMLGKQKPLLDQLAEGCVLTPHMKEFDFLFGEHDSWWARLQTAREKAKQANCVILLKNQYTFVVGPEGNVTVNPTGNPAMAQGGMGDVLTGFIVSFLAQGYTAYQAAVIACYLHGMAGDELAKEKISVTASAVADQLPGTLKRLIR